jgi:hypothetical protein
MEPDIGDPLDRAVATALGYSADMPASVCPAFSVAPSCISEMTEWLSGKGGSFLEITLWRDDNWCAKLFGTERHRLDTEADGNTFSEALARLVVAVASKEEP